VPSLFVIKGRDQGKRFELSGGVIGLGRESSNKVQLFDTEVSRRHAELRQAGNSYAVFDRESSNGTFVNNERVGQSDLASGDRLQVGRTLMIYTATDSGSSEDLAESVDIVGRDHGADGSRIVTSIGQDASSNILGGSVSSSPWLARARSNLQVMYRTALAVSHTLDIEQLCARIMDLIFEWVDADRGCVMLVNGATDELEPKVRRTRKGEKTDDRISISRTILDYVMEHKEGVLTSDAREDQRWDPEGSILKLGVREAMCVPMQGRYGIVGVIYVDTYTPPGQLITTRGTTKFHEEHLKLMVAIGHQAALAVEDTNYYSAMVHAERLAAVGQAIATLSHHVKNILQGIRGGSYLIDEGLKSDDGDVVRKGWTIVERNQEKISNLVMDMLTFSKEREPDPVPSDINEVTADVIELIQVRAQEQNVQLTWRPGPDMPAILFDPDALQRAILNLITNAIDACEESDEPQVKVSTRHVPDSAVVRIIVEDNGSGIEADDLKKIFTVFESRKGARGTGLGLPVSQKIVREHGGDIQVQSTPGAGSSFVIELPAVLPEAAESSRHSVDGTHS
jgi:two-component system NtrC family sensor kinase